MKFPRKYRYILISIFFGVFIGIIIAELVLRFLGIGYGNSPMESSHFLHHVHPANYAFLHHHPLNEYGGSIVIYDSQGLRVLEKESIRKGNTPFRIAFMGD
jgi:hypothetical protein